MYEARDRIFTYNKLGYLRRSPGAATSVRSSINMFTAWARANVCPLLVCAHIRASMVSFFTFVNVCAI